MKDDEKFCVKNCLHKFRDTEKFLVDKIHRTMETLIRSDLSLMTAYKDEEEKKGGAGSHWVHIKSIKKHESNILPLYWFYREFHLSKNLIISHNLSKLTILLFALFNLSFKKKYKYSIIDFNLFLNWNGQIISFYVFEEDKMFGR